MDASQYSGQDQAALNRLIEQKQMKDFLKLYSGLVERCFTACCNDFTSRALSTKEESCVNNCADKFLKHSERVGARFSEHNAEMMQKQQQQSSSSSSSGGGGLFGR